METWKEKIKQQKLKTFAVIDFLLQEKCKFTYWDDWIIKYSLQSYMIITAYQIRACCSCSRICTVHFNLFNINLLKQVFHETLPVKYSCCTSVGSKLNMQVSVRKKGISHFLNYI